TQGPGFPRVGYTMMGSLTGNGKSHGSGILRRPQHLRPQMPGDRFGHEVCRVIGFAAVEYRIDDDDGRPGLRLAERRQPQLSRDGVGLGTEQWLHHVAGVVTPPVTPRVAHWPIRCVGYVALPQRRADQASFVPAVRLAT